MNMMKSDHVQRFVRQYRCKRHPGQKRNKTANNNVKKLQFMHNLTRSATSKTAKSHRVVLLSSTLTFRHCAGV